MIKRININTSVARRASGLLIAIAITILASTQLRADTGACGGASLTLPFADVPASNVFFCAIAQAFFTGLTNGTTATTYSPAANVTRDQMAAFITRTQDSVLKRGSGRAIARQWAMPKEARALTLTPVGDQPQYNCFDGKDIWVANAASDSVTRVHASDGRVLGTWTAAIGAYNTIAAAGFIYVTGRKNPGKIYRIDPTQTPGAVTEVATTAGANPVSITYDGLNLWTANHGAFSVQGSVTRYNIVTNTQMTVAAGFTKPAGIVFDGTHLWVVDEGADALHRVNPANGTIIETLAMGTISSGDSIPVFDGSNVWVLVMNQLKVVSTSTPARLIATLTGNGLNNNRAIAFDGERILVTVSGELSLWKASSLTPLGTLSLQGLTEAFATGVCSDGLHFWIVVEVLGNGALMRF